MTRVDLARSTEIPVSTINNWYVANRYPRIDQAESIARSLEIPLDTLMTSSFSAATTRLHSLAAQLSESDTSIVCDIMRVLIDHRAMEEDA